MVQTITQETEGSLRDFLDRILLLDNRDLFVQLPDESVDLVLTDPPYKSYRSNRPKAHPRLKLVDRKQFDLEFFARESFRVLKPGCHLYCFCDHITFPEVRRGLEEAGFTYKNCLVWVKNNHGSGDLKGNWAPQHEFILFASKGKSRPLQGKRPSNVLAKKLGRGKIEFFSKVFNYKYHHGTTKPVDLLRIIIMASTRPGEVVLDPYGGSGSTAEACLREDRRYIVSEIDPEYFEIAKKRTADISLLKLQDSSCES